MEDNSKSDSDDEYDVHFISNAASRLQGVLRKISNSPSLRFTTMKGSRRSKGEDPECHHSPNRSSDDESLMARVNLTPPPVSAASHQVTKRSAKTATAIATLAAVKRRRVTTIDDLDDSIEILEKNCEAPKNMAVKIRWKHQVKRVDVNPAEKIRSMLMKFSDEVGVDASMLRFLLEGKTLEPNKSLDDYNITVASIVDAQKVGQEARQTIKIKFQMENRKNSRVLPIGITEKFEKIVDQFSAELDVPSNKIHILCDGESIPLSKTPLDLDLEDGDCLDLHFLP